MDLYPQLDRDNVDSNPKSAKTYAKRAPVGDVVTNDLKKSITRETIDLFCKDFGKGLVIQSVTGTQQPTATLTFTKNHGLGGVVDGTLVVGTGTRVNGTYYNVKLYNENTFSSWNGATAKVVVQSNAITSYEFMARGSGYQNGGRLYFDTTDIGGNANAYIQLSTSGITTYVGDVVQITGNGYTDDGYYRINSVGVNTITIAKHATDPLIVSGQYAFVIGRSVKIQSTSYTEEQTVVDGETTTITGLITFNTTDSHGLSVGNKFRVINSSNLNLGDFVVSDVTSVTSFRANAESDFSSPTAANNGYILKHGLSSNQGISDIRTESYSSRTIPFYSGETFKLTSAIDAGDPGTLNIQCLTGISTSKRLKLGDVLQVDDEIFRVSATPTNTSVQVLRGYLGTRQGDHPLNSIVKKVDVIPIEFRRPSIIRASGHTFEYLGYGPGNYSTALPQVQTKTLSEREDFLVQAQERSAGAVIYTGMNSKGDTFNGNTKVSASSGQTVSYDIPKPTITGQDPSKLSVVFDEVTVRERILVEGGTSGQVLSQFDGPVTMTKSLRVKGKFTLNGQLRVTYREKAVNENSGSVVVKGGIGVGDDSYFRTKVQILGEVGVGTGIIPNQDLVAYIGSATTAFNEAFVGNIKIGATTNNTIDTRSGGLTINATSGNLVETASGAITQTASGGNLTQTASAAITQTASGGNLTQTASGGISQTATTGKITITASANDIEYNAGVGKSITYNKSVYVIGDLQVRGSESVPPGLNSGTIRANYLEIPNITPVGGVVIWSGNENQLPAVTVNGAVVTMWAVCNGQAISRATYSQLFGIIGTKFGSGDGSTTFNLPDLRNRFLIGSNSDSGSNIETDESNVPLSAKRSGGSKDSILVTHNHDLSSDTVGVDEGAHVHGVQITDSGSLSMSGGTTEGGGSHTHQASATNPTGGIPFQYQSANSISGGTHNHTYKWRADGGTSNDGPDKPKDANIDQENVQGGGEHSHQLAITADIGHSHPVTFTANSGTHNHQVQVSGAQHGHPDSIVTGTGTHSHTVSTEGESRINKNLPPYYALYYIMRIL